MPIPNYGVLVGSAKDKREAQDTHDHYQILLSVQDESNRIAVDVHSKEAPSQVEFVVNPNFTHPITSQLAALDEGFYAGSEQNGLRLDFVRQPDLFDHDGMVPLPIFSEPSGRDLNDQLDDYIDMALADSDAKVYAFGQRFGPDDKSDYVFHFSPAQGIHDIHMNQGNVGGFKKDNGIWQDGALIIHLINPDERWIGLFLKFQSQSWQTDDSGAALSEITI